MLRHAILAGACACFVSLPHLRAEPVPPAAPADPAPIADASDPKGALKLLNAALRDGNLERIRTLLHTESPLEARMVDAMARMAEAFADLHTAAVEAFGAENARHVTGDNDARWAEGLARIDSAEVRIDGNTATVRYEAAQSTTEPASDTAPPDPPPAEEKSAPVVLKRIKGKWKLPVAQLAAGADPTSLEQRLAEIAVQTRLVREVTEEITEGKFSTAEEAAEAWHSRFMQSLGPKPREKKDDKVKG